jgi:hypothetical protein
MKKSKLHLIFSLTFFSILLSSCSVIGGIFKTGMGVGIFIVIAVIIGIILLVVRSGKNK